MFVLFKGCQGGTLQTDGNGIDVRKNGFISVESCLIRFPPSPSPSISTVTFAGVMLVRVAG